MSTTFSRKSTKFENPIISSKQRWKGDENNLSSKSRTLALEQAYVHDVYSVIAASNPDAVSSPVRSYVKNFIFNEFEPGSIVLDVGCGDGKYLNLNPDVIVIGLDYCAQWFASDSQYEQRQLVVADGMYLPFLDDFFDGIISCGVLHHISTIERRISLLKELSRVLKIGGKMLVTVTSNPPSRKKIESQDVLIRVDMGSKKQRSEYSESDIDSKSYTSSSSETSFDSANNINALNKTSQANSEFDNCYSFVKKAFKRLSLTSGISSFRNSFTTGLTSLGSPVKSRRGNRQYFRYNQSDLFPIELHNLDEFDSTSNLSSKSSSTTGDSALSSFNRSSSLSQTSTNNIFSSSLISVIKEHLNSWKVQLNTAAVRHSFDSKPSNNNECDTKHLNLFGYEGIQGDHRFSLPISFWNFTKPVEPVDSASKNLLGKNKIYASNEVNMPKFQNYLEKNGINSIELNLKSKPEEETKNNLVESKCKSLNRSRGSLVKVRLHLDFQKSLSLEFLKNLIVDDESVKGYCSLPDLTSPLFEGNRHRIDLSNKYNFHRLISNENQIKPSKIHLMNPNMNEDAESDLSVSPSPISPNPDSFDQSCSNDEEMKENPSDLNHGGASKFSKKLLRQRSFSADYQPETVKLTPELPRRFSASPNIGTHRYNQNDHIPHHQQISIDSEESFVTIIPAHPSNRNNIIENNDFDEEEECDSLNDDEDYLDSSDEDDDAYCENLSNDEKTSEDNSISSVLEAKTVRSVVKSNSNETCADSNETGSPIEDDYERQDDQIRSKPPNSLHRYFHLFRNDELETLIEENVQNLHIIDSYYQDSAVAWCVVVEKIHVWTI